MLGHAEPWHSPWKEVKSGKYREFREMTKISVSLFSSLGTCEIREIWVSRETIRVTEPRCLPLRNGEISDIWGKRVNDQSLNISFFPFFSERVKKQKSDMSAETLRVRCR